MAYGIDLPIKYVWFIAHSLQIAEYQNNSLKIKLYSIVNLALFVWGFVWKKLHTICRLLYDKQKIDKLQILFK